MSYREIRVRPVVRYIVTDFTCDDDYGNQKSIPFGEFDNVDRANVVAYAMAEAEVRTGQPGAGFLRGVSMAAPFRRMIGGTGMVTSGVDLVPVYQGDHLPGIMAACWRGLLGL